MHLKSFCLDVGNREDGNACLVLKAWQKNWRPPACCESSQVSEKPVILLPWPNSASGLALIIALSAELQFSCETQGTCMVCYVLCWFLQRFVLKVPAVHPSFVIQHIDVSIRTIVWLWPKWSPCVIILYLFIFCSDMESVESADAQKVSTWKKTLASDLSN